MIHKFIDLLGSLMSSNNELRDASEKEFNRQANADPDLFLTNLINIGSDHSCPPQIRLASLLHLKRYLPNFWSPAFDSYIGTKTTDQNVKQLIRSSLFSLLGDEDSKIRNAAAYAIVQVAVVDYPDEWPNLLNDLYAAITSNASNVSLVLGSISTLDQLFDDLVTDEQFFQGGVAVQIMKSCELMLTDEKYNVQVKVATLSLVESIIKVLPDIEYYEESQRKTFVSAVVPRIVGLLAKLSSKITELPQPFTSSIMLWTLKSKIYSCLNLLMDSFSRFFKDIASSFINAILIDLSREENSYVAIFCSDNISQDEAIKSSFSDADALRETIKESITPDQVISASIRHEIQLLQSLLELHPLNDEHSVSSLVQLLYRFNYLPSEKLEDYGNDFNAFVTDETELAIDITIRSSVIGFFTDLNELDASLCTKAIVSSVISMTLQNNRSNYRDLESLLTILSCLFDNEYEDKSSSFSIPKFSEFISSFIRHGFESLNNGMELLLSRFILLMPKFLMKYESKLSVNPVDMLKLIVSYVDKLPSGGNCQILKSSILISFQYFNQFIRAKFFDREIQFKLISLIGELAEDSDEDTNIMMLEALTILICIDNKAAASTDDTFMLILTIGYKDCSNFSLNTPTLECVSDLISGIPLETYLALSEKVMVKLITILVTSKGDYSSEVDLTLQILAEFIKGPNADFKLPQQLFEFIFMPVCEFIMQTSDDHLLQSASSVFNEIVKRSTEQIEIYNNTENGESGKEILLKIVSKFLSPTVTDQALVNLGSLFILIIDNFSNSDLIKQYFSDMLRGVTIRLLRAKEVPTIENLILIFNKLMIMNAQDTLIFLKGFRIDENGTSALVQIFPIWFQSFEVMRGFSKILGSVQAFSELLLLNDPSIASIQTRGDVLPNQIPENVIVTRSMSKNMKLKYEIIPVDAKIIRLFIKELRFQIQSVKSNERDAIVDAKLVIGKDTSKTDDNADDNEWEDIDELDVPSYDQLQHYIDEGNEPSELNAHSERVHSEIRDYLIRFFKECFNGKVHRFQEIYNKYLHDSDKKLLTESLVF